MNPYDLGASVSPSAAAPPTVKIYDSKGKVIKEVPGTSLAYADLSGADLSGANLRGADLDEKTVMPDGESWKVYLTVTVPALLKAAGKALYTFEKHWQCHTWENCPIAYAFNTNGLKGVPILLRPRADEFIRFYDAKLIPWSVIQEAADKDNPPVVTRSVVGVCNAAKFAVRTIGGFARRMVLHVDAADIADATVVDSFEDANKLFAAWCAAQPHLVENWKPEIVGITETISRIGAE